MSRSFGKAVVVACIFAFAGCSAEFEARHNSVYATLMSGDCSSILDQLASSAENGDVTAQYNLGVCYEEGLGIDPDFDQAFKWTKLAANSGNSDAQVRLGSMYEMGRGGTMNFEDAVA